MMSDFDLSQELSTTQENINFFLVCQLLVKGGTKALTIVFDKIHPPQNLGKILTQASIRQRLAGLKHRKVINQSQWNLLYPIQNTQVASLNFDISLLFVLLRNICNFQAPTRGWDVLPDPNETSVPASLACIKYYRNKFCHNPSASINQDEFDVYWDDISRALVNLGANQDDIESFKKERVGHDLEERYIEDIKEWALQDEAVKIALERLEHKFDAAIEGASHRSDTDSDVEHSCCFHGKELVLFCNTCSVTICLVCNAGKHRDHQISDLAETAKTLRSSLESEIRKLENNRSSIRQSTSLASETLDALSEQVKGKREIIEKHTTQTILRIRQEIKDREEQILKELEEQYSDAIREICEEQDSLNTAEEDITSSISYIENALRSKDDVQLLALKKSIKKTLDDKIPRESKFLKNYDKVADFYPEELSLNGKLGILARPPLSPLSYVYDRKLPRHIRKGETTTLKINAVNIAGEKVRKCDSIEATQKDADGKVKKLEVQTSSSKRETHTVEFTVQVDGEHKVSVYLRKQHITGSPFLFNVRPWRVTKYPNQKTENSERVDSQHTPCVRVKGDRNGNLHLLNEPSKNSIQVLTGNFHKESSVCLEDRIKTFSPGNFTVSICGKFYFVTNANDNSRYPVIVFNDKGKITTRSFGKDRLSKPRGIATDNKGENVYVSDVSKHAILQFLKDGKYVRSFGSHGENSEQFDHPNYIAVDGTGRVIVSDFGNHRVQVFSCDGEFIFSFGRVGHQEGQFWNPRGIGIDHRNNIYICDSNNHRIQMFNRSGEYICYIQSCDLRGPLDIAVVPCNHHGCKLVIIDQEKAYIKVYA